MKVLRPVWTLRQPCPCCQQSGLVLVACPICGAVAAQCEESESFFSDPKDLKITAQPADTCTGCGATPFRDCAVPTDRHLNAAGLTGLYH